ncbi:hypothetical protein D0T84_14605 [Dysgonomonas sp. 521]|nr:hypothetical protein [Dysgonomonas sp. 521]
MSKYIKNSSPEKTIRTFYSENLHTNHIHPLPQKTPPIPTLFFFPLFYKKTKGKSKRKQL